MANNLSVIEGKILANSLRKLRKKNLFPRLVNSDFSSDTAKKGSVIHVPLPGTIGTSAVTPGVSPPTPSSNTPTEAQVALDQWKGTDHFHLSDKELGEIDSRKDFIPARLEEAVEGCANDANEYLVGLYTGVYNAVGTAGTTPFGSTSDVAVDARKKLNQSNAPDTNRWCVLDVEAEANAVKLDEFKNADKSGSTDVIKSGRIGEKYGAEWMWDNAIPLHTTGSAGTELIKGGSQTGTSIICDGFTTKPSAGDVFTVAGDTQQYVVTASTTLSGTESTLTISPAITSAPADNAAMTFLASHRVNLMFHRDAFAFAMRAPADMTVQGGKRNTTVMQDPQTGIALRLERHDEYKQTAWELDFLYGATLVRPELACRIMGAGS